MTIQFNIEGEQATKYLKWQLKHRKCDSEAGAVGGAVSITFTPTGIGMMTEANCSICGKKLDLTEDL